MSGESITPTCTTDRIFVAEISYNYGKWEIKFKGICFKQDNVYFIHGNVVNLYISYKSDTWSRDLNTDFALGVLAFLELWY